LLSKEVLKNIREINRKRGTAMFIEPQHPKGELPPKKEDISNLIRWGWWGQKKVNGYRCQIHISSEGEVKYFTRQGTAHTRTIPETIKEQLTRHLTPSHGYNVLDAEWQRQQEKIYLFDVLKLEDKLLDRQTFEERHQILRKDLFFIEPNINFLPVYKSVHQCMQVLAKNEDWIEGLVFKLPGNKGWKNDAIIRCRKAK
jgi:ATP-dependent DNA ligase